jgi:hypothetical protein
MVSLLLYGMLHSYSTKFGGRAWASHQRGFPVLLLLNDVWHHLLLMIIIAVVVLSVTQGRLLMLLLEKARAATSQKASPSIVKGVATILRETMRTHKALAWHVKSVHLLGECSTVTLLRIITCLHKLLVSRGVIGGLSRLLWIPHLEAGDFRGT